MPNRRRVAANGALLMPWTDTHCHLHLYDEPDAVAGRAGDRGVRIVALPTGPDEFQAVRDLAGRHPHVEAGAGLVPQRAIECVGRLEEVAEAISATRWVGEIGLDYVTPDEADRVVQRRVFDRLLAAAAARGDAVLSIHSRRAEADVIDRVGQGFPGTIILHWFSGDPALAERTDGRVFFSVNPAMAGSKPGRSRVAALPRERILLESDGPFVRHGDRPAEPADLHGVVAVLAQMWQIDLPQAQSLLAANQARADK